MFEETRKYTEEVYVSKEELAQRLGLTGAVLDAVWKQVEDYRALPRRSLCFNDLHADIVMTRALCAKLQQMTELLYRCLLQHPFSAAVQESVLLAGNYPHWLYRAGELLALASLPHGFVTSLEQEEEPLLLRIFFLSMFTGEGACLDCLPVHERCHAPFILAMEEQPNRTAAGDPSIRFLAFSGDIRLQVSRSMLSLTETSVTACQTMQLQELLEQYPMLNEQQLIFYVNHRQPYRYYTIRQFMEYAGVCNETVRCTMELLVKQHCYQRRKIGRKYVYYTVQEVCMKAVYVHVPFCRDICAYCDFTRCRYHAGLADQWLIAVKRELQEKLAQVSVETVYIGGGTPSVLNSRQLEQLLKLLTSYTTQVREYTVEANVESLDEDRMKLLKRYGVNRISLGVQTLQPVLLSITGRRHTREEVVERIRQLHQYGVHNISVDPIYGLPQQVTEMRQDDLQDIVQHFQISHISLYALTIEGHSQSGRSGVENIDVDVETGMHLYAVSYLKEHGFIQYEISNFAKLNAASLHNQMYWNYEDFCGIGCGANGKSGHIRYDNTRNLHTYLQKGSYLDIIELSRQDEMFEMLMMALRMKKGMNLSLFRECFAADFETIYPAPLRENITNGMLQVKDDHVRTAEEGMLLLHDILVDFLSEETL